MKFIFPQNYNFKTKLFGLLDYPTVFFNFIFFIIIFIFTKLFIHDLFTKIIIFIVTCFPIFLISCVAFQQENIVYVLIYLFKFYKNDKIYIYRKLNF